jgi:hypothetical protein
MVRYKVKPDQAARNEELIRAVYAELAEKRPAGVRYSASKLDDGVTFVHLARVQAQDGQSPLAALDAFKAFQRDIRARCEEQPVVVELTQIGSFRWLDD